MTTQKIRSAVIPVAGLGTRFLPATKSVPKELLPIVDKPTLQYIVEEAVASGIEQIVFVNGRNKVAIEDHFDYSYELEDTLRRRGKDEEADALKAIADSVNIVSVRQKFPGGLGHAVLAARDVVGDEPFAVLLGDDIIRTTDVQRPGIRQLMDAFENTGLGQVALMTVPLTEIHKYGAAEGTIDPDNKSLFKISALVEKPPLGTEKTDQAVIGRYVLPASIWRLLVETPKGQGGEIQLTDALHRLKDEEGLMGVKFQGLRVDAGDKLGYLAANLLEALDRKDLRQGTLELMARLLKENP